MTMHKGLHTRDDIDKPCMSRKEGGREFDSTEDCVDATIEALEEYTKKKKKKTKERLITVANSSNVSIRTINKTTKSRKRRREEKNNYPDSSSDKLRGLPE